jgi:hypothetical protein
MRHIQTYSQHQSVSYSREGIEAVGFIRRRKKEIVVAYSATPCLILVLTLIRGQSDTSETVTVCNRCIGGEASTSIGVIAAARLLMQIMIRSAERIF